MILSLFCIKFRFGNLQAHNTVTLPYTARRNEATYLVKLETLKRFEFTSQTMKSGAIAVPQDESDDTAMLFIKGAPSIIQSMADAATVPANFAKVYNKLNSVFTKAPVYCAAYTNTSSCFC